MMSHLSPSVGSIVTHTLLTAAVMLGVFVNSTHSQAAPPASLVVDNSVRHEIKPGLFGQFLERPGGGETGPELFADLKTGQLPPRIMEMLKQMKIPVIRFPGGTDIDYTDWRDMISNVPGREPTTAPAQRPLSIGKSKIPASNRFGYDEYFALQKQLGCETILVVKNRDAIAKKVPLAEAAQLAAGLVAYTNAQVGAKLPAGMPDWPAIRAQNGHPEPYKVRYFQIGNEAWIFMPTVLEELQLKDNPAAIAPWLIECYLEYARQMRAVDPSIELIIDGNLSNKLAAIVLADPRIRALNPLIARHVYAPGPMDKIWKGPTTNAAEISDEVWWSSLTGMPGYFDEQGQNIGPGEELDLARSLKLRSVCTEWNWLAFGIERIHPRPNINVRYTATMGVAGFIHGLMRNGDQIELATQSMLLGNGWNFTAIHAESADDPSPYFSPQGLTTTFYNDHHGKQLLKTTLANVATYPQPFNFGWGPLPSKAVGMLDVLATADEQRIYIHAINRDMKEDLPLTVELRGFSAPAKPGPITHRYLTGRPLGQVKPEEVRDVVRVETKELPYAPGNTITLTLPAHSVSIFEIPR